jgi:hypothetical protein
MDLLSPGHVLKLSGRSGADADKLATDNVSDILPDKDLEKARAGNGHGVADPCSMVAHAPAGTNVSSRHTAHSDWTRNAVHDMPYSDPMKTKLLRAMSEVTSLTDVLGTGERQLRNSVEDTLQCPSADESPQIGVWMRLAAMKHQQGMCASWLSMERAPKQDVGAASHLDAAAANSQARHSTSAGGKSCWLSTALPALRTM